MPPIRVFLRVSSHRVIPVRLFINRKAIAQSHQIHAMATAAVPAATGTRHRKALVKLKRVSRIRLSDRDIERLIDEFKTEILTSVLDTPVEALAQSSSAYVAKDEFADTNKDILYVPLEQNGWKCLLVLSQTNLKQIRESLNPNAMGSHHKLSGLLIKEDEMAAKEEVMVLVEGESPPPPTKQHMSTKYHGTKILGQAIDIHVHARPAR